MKTVYKERQRVSHDGQRLHFNTTMQVDPIFDGVKHMNTLMNPERDKTGRLYLGSIDPITAEVWSRECGFKIGTKGWAAYAKKKLMTGDYAKLRANPERKVFRGANVR